MKNYSKNLFGVMQGRLLPKYNGRYQAHPVGYWQDEFTKAAEFGLDCIEFIFDYNDFEISPLISLNGIDEILEMESKTGVTVNTVCADYFMEAPLHHTEDMIASKSKETLGQLLNNGGKLGLTDIVIPCVDQSSLADESANKRFIRNLMPYIEMAEKLKINLSLETDLAPEPFAELLGNFDSKRVSVNYDTGNSASLGYDPVEELKCYGERITDIHIKDRVLGGGSILLGNGSTEFDTFFDALESFSYTGPFIMQAYRDDEGVEVFKNQLDWLKEKYSFLFKV